MNQFTQNLIQKYWQDGLDKRLPGLVSLLVIMMLAHTMAQLTWNLIPVPDFEENVSSFRGDPQQARVSRSKDQPLANKIGQWHLFGKFEVNKPKVVAPVVQEEIQETKLNLKLLGLLSSSQKANARAIISDAKGSEDSYAIEDEVPGGAILNDILADRVLLEHNGRLEVLKLPINPVADGGRNPSFNSRSRNNSRSSRSSRNNPSVSTATGDTSVILRQFRDQLMNDPQSMMGLVRAQPYRENGQLKGYRIRPGKDRQLLRRFGLRSGDIVTAINGVPMNNPIKALEVMRDLSSATQLTVDVERRGNPRTFTFSIAE